MSYCTLAHLALVSRQASCKATAILILAIVSLLGGQLCLAEIQNDAIGFSPNHVFSGALEGERVDVLNGNLNLRIPIGPKYMLNDWFGYQIELYYNCGLSHFLSATRCTTTRP